MAARKVRKRAVRKSKKAAKRVEKRGSGLLTGPEVRDGILHFSAPDLSLYELRMERVKSIALGIEAHKTEAARLKLAYEAEVARAKAAFEDSIRKLQLRLQELMAESNVRGRELVEVQGEIESLYNIQIRDLIYDDETGKVSTKDGPVLAE